MKIALIQLNAGPNKAKNIAKAVKMVERAARSKAAFILLPEVFNYRGPFNRSVAEKITGPSVKPFVALAKKYRTAILLGSLYERIEGSKKVYNTSVLIDARGKVSARYRKINLFEATLGRKKIRESVNFRAGRKSVLTRVGNFKIGLSICYDIRFPGQYRKYAKSGADVLCIPSSFTYPTGKAHWETLVRARAIENLSYVLAPNQVGKDGKGVKTYGHSMIVDPWGKVIAQASANKEEIIYAKLDKNEIKKARQRLPRALD